MGMAGLLGIYVQSRAEVMAQGQIWLPKGVTIPLTQPNMMAITLVMSMVAMAWAVSAIRHDDRCKHAYCLVALCCLRLAYLAQTGFLLEIMGMPAAGDDLARPPLFYALIGAHMLIMAAAMLYVIVMGLRTLGGNYNARMSKASMALLCSGMSPLCCTSLFGTPSTSPSRTVNDAHLGFKISIGTVGSGASWCRGLWPGHRWRPDGVISVGYKGGVGCPPLATPSCSSPASPPSGWPWVGIVTRDGDAEAMADSAGVSAVPALPTLSSVYWAPITRVRCWPA